MAAVEDAAVVGQPGEVLVRIRGRAGPGEIVVSVRGTTETFIAYADEVIERGTHVLVVTSRGNRAVDVIRWSG
jgi:membrane protein implicated in regulation of membrane protease activity